MNKLLKLILYKFLFLIFSTEMQSGILIILFLAIGVECVRRTSRTIRINDTVTVYRRGFKISVLNIRRTESVRFEGNCLSNANHLGFFNYTANSPLGDHWTYWDNNTVLTYGNVINYSIHMTIRNLEYKNENIHTVNCAETFINPKNIIVKFVFVLLQ